MKHGAGASIVLVTPNGQHIMLAFLLDFQCSNNEKKFEALILGVQLFINLQAKTVNVYGDSLLILS